MSIPLDMISRADAPVHSIQQLSERIEALGTQISLFKKLGALVVAIASIIGALTFFAPDEPEQPVRIQPVTVSPGGQTQPLPPANPAAREKPVAKKL